MTEQPTVLSVDDRGVALDLAVRFFTADRYTGSTKQITATAREFYRWLEGSADRAVALGFAVRMFTAGRYSGGPQEVIKVAEQFTRFLEGPVPARMQFAITIEGEPEMPLTVDSANAVAILSFTDDHGDAVAPPDGVLATAASSDTTILTVGAGVPGADVNGIANIQFPLTEVAEGTSTLTAAATDANGNPLLGPDGVTPIPAADPVVVTVNPGAPAAEVFTVPGA